MHSPTPPPALAALGRQWNSHTRVQRLCEDPTTAGAVAAWVAEVLRWPLTLEPGLDRYEVRAIGRLSWVVAAPASYAAAQLERLLDSLPDPQRVAFGLHVPAGARIDPQGVRLL